MAKLLIFEGTYYSDSDESAFFAWLSSISGVVRIVGFPYGLEVTLRTKNLSQIALRDLIALHFRYGLPMKDLAQFKTQKNSIWFENPIAYWYANVFGVSAVSADIEARLLDLDNRNASPAEVVKALRKEYGLSLYSAKRFLHVFLWQRKESAL